MAVRIRKPSLPMLWIEAKISQCTLLAHREGTYVKTCPRERLKEGPTSGGRRLLKFRHIVLRDRRNAIKWIWYQTKVQVFGAHSHVLEGVIRVGRCRLEKG